MTARAVISIALLCSGLVTAACAQDVPPPPDQPPQTDQGDPSGQAAEQPAAASSMEVAAHLWAVIARYRYAASADRVRVTLVSPDGSSEMHSLVIRCVPGDAGLARLDLGELEVVARDGRLRAAHRRDPTTYAELRGETDSDATGPAAVLRSLLPPLAIPQISLAFDEAAVHWCPLVEGLEWRTAERIARDGLDGVRLRGQSDSGAVTLEIINARVRRLEAELGGGSRLVVECEPVEAPGEPASWVLAIDGRRQVSGLGALRPLGQRVAVGGRLPRLSIIDPDTGRTSVVGGVTAETGFSAVLLIRDDAPEPLTRDGIVAVLLGMTEFERELLRRRIDGRLDESARLSGLTGVIHVDASGQVLERIETQSAAWTEAVAAVRPGETRRPDLGWTGGESRLLDRLAPGASHVLLLLGEGGEILAVIDVTEASGSGEIADALAAAIPGDQ